MGSCFSRSSCPTITGVRVVHLSGYVEDFEAPITAKEVTGGIPTHFLCTMSHIVHGSRAIRPEVQLENGRIYFLLPYTALESDTSQLELISLGKKLNAIARSNHGVCKAKESILNLDAATSKGNSKAHKRCPFQKRLDEAKGAAIWKPTLECIVEIAMECSSMNMR